MNRIKLSAIFIWIGFFIVSSVFSGLTILRPADFTAYSGDKAEEELQTQPAFVKTDVHPVSGTIARSVTSHIQPAEQLHYTYTNGLTIAQAFSFICSRPPPA